MSEALEKRPGWLARIAGVSAPVDQKTYAAVGFGLMLFKYATDAALTFVATGELLHPLIYLAPALSLRMDAMQGAEWLLPVLFAWTLPFMWVGTSMTVRRMRDAGLPSTLGLFFFMPVVNYLVMLGLCVLPSRPEHSEAKLPLQSADRLTWSVLAGVAAGIAITTGMVTLSAVALGEYGLSLFVGTPFVIGAVSTFLLNLRQQRGLIANWAVSTLTVAVSGGALMLFALEGALCLAMLAPLAMVLAYMGGFLGYGLARIEARRPMLTSVAALPILTLVEPEPRELPLHEVSSAVVIEAPPEEVWPLVVSFEDIELSAPPRFVYDAGVAYPLRARMEGTGVGAVRYCEFSTGPFVEPITHWEEPVRLSFDVEKSPPSMHEWSPYDEIWAPHIDHALKSRRGEFRLIDLGDGRTRLEGSTWYTLDIWPNTYWTVYSDALIGGIHDRVLNHIKETAE